MGEIRQPIKKPVIKEESVEVREPITTDVRPRIGIREKVRRFIWRT